jgi:PAS domain S-box-containing protein
MPLKKNVLQEPTQTAALAAARTLSNLAGSRVLTPSRLALVALTLIGATAGFVWWSLTRQDASAAWVDHTTEVIDHAQQVRSLLTDAETGQRGFLITGKETYLAPYHAALAQLPAELLRLKRLTADNQRQQQRLDSVALLTKQKLDTLAQTIRLYRTKGKVEAWSLVASDRGKNDMDEIRSQLARVEVEEHVLLAERMQRSKQDRLNATAGAGGGLLLALFALALLRQRLQKLELGKTLLDSENRFQKMFEIAPFSIATIDTQNQCIGDFNTLACQELGYTREEFRSLRLADFVALSTAELDANVAMMAGIFSAGGSLVRFASKHRTKAGDIHNVLVSAAPLQLADKRYYFVAFQDITEQERAAAALRESELQFRTLANAIPHLCWIANADGWIFWYNQRWYDFTGTTPEQMEGWGWKSVHQASSLPEVLDRWKMSIASGTPFEMNFALLGADGVYHPFLTRIVPVKDDLGNVIRWFGTNTDLSTQQKNQEALSSHAADLQVANADLRIAAKALGISEHTTRLLFENASQGILTVDNAGRIVDANATLTKLFGYQPSELIGASVEILLSESLRHRHVAHRAAYKADPKVRPMGQGMDLWAHRKDGSEFPVEVSLSYVAGLCMAFVADITARKQANAERELSIAKLKNALAEKTVLLQEVDHRVKNNMAVIAGLLGLQANAIGDPRLSEALEESKQRVSSMALVHEYLYATPQLDRVNFGQYLVQLSNELRTCAKRSDLVALAIEAEEIDLPVDLAIPCGLILNELVSNAFKHAFPNDRVGKVTVAFRKLASGELLLSCRDDGIGFPPQFDWQTSSSLGLEIVRILTTQIDGRLTQDPSQNVGTGFELTFAAVNPRNLAASA